MSQKIDIDQSNLVIAKLGATTKTKAQLVATYPTAKSGQFVLADTEVYQCVSAGVWKIYKELPENIAFTDVANEFGPTQSIVSGGIKTKAPTGAERSIVQIGKVATNEVELEIDPLKFIPWMDNGQYYKVPVLRLKTSPAYYEKALSFAATIAPACTSEAPTTYYSSEENLVEGSIIYTDSALTTPLNTAGYYGNGSVWYQINASGAIVGSGDCETYMVNAFDFEIAHALVPDEEMSGISLLLSSDFPEAFFNESDLNYRQNWITVDGSSDRVSFDLRFIFGVAMTVSTIITITDGTTDYAGVITGNGTTDITISFNVGGSKGRTFGLKPAQNNIINFSRL
ncbi:hypothetical protein [Roseivirga seohaensis]|uniref:hypothetical protein n=1 Tax=Roseivirga seohaensis TaxID=1914963 RepID=UPI003BA994E6